MDRHPEESLPELAGCRVRFVTLMVECVDGIAVEVTHIDPILLAFDPEGRRALLGPPDGLAPRARSGPAVIRAMPSADELEAVLRAHGLRNHWRPRPGPTALPLPAPSGYPITGPARSSFIVLVLAHPPLRLPRASTAWPVRITAAELRASLSTRWASWHPGSVSGEYPWLMGHDVDQQVRGLAELAVERLWDQLAAWGLATGELVDFGMFPSIFDGGAVWWVPVPARCIRMPQSDPTRSGHDDLQADGISVRFTRRARCGSRAGSG